MPTLPERATSILGVLARQTPVPVSVPVFVPSPDTTLRAQAQPFDWRAIVEAKKPGSKTDSQREQALRVRRVIEALHAWVRERDLPVEHAEEAALYAVVSTSPSTPDSRTLALALVVLWIYLLDDFLDRRSVADPATPATLPAGQALALIDRDLAAILAPLAPLTSLVPSVPASPAHPTGFGLLRAAAARFTHPPVRSVGSLTASPAFAFSPPSLEAVSLACALAAVLAALDAEWMLLSATGAAREVRRTLFAQHLTACTVAMRQELVWNLAHFTARTASSAREGDALPTFEAYLRNGAVSIGMSAVAAAAASFEPQPADAWKHATAAVDAGGAVVRLTNDLHTYFADVEEGKVTSVTIRAGLLGAPASTQDAESSPEVRAAQAALGADLARAVATFGEVQAGLFDGPLAYCARHAVAFALAVYGDGSRYRERAA
jgi:hypothetical protein